MGNRQITHLLNLLPPHLATLKAWQEKFPIDQIEIRPTKGIHSGEAKEVIKAWFDEHKNTYFIETKSRSKAREELEKDMPVKSDYTDLVGVFDRELSLFKIGLSERLLRHTLGLSPLQSDFFDLPQKFDQEQQDILSFYLPYQEQIRNEFLLIEMCLFTALGQKATVEPTSPKKIKIKGTPLNKFVMSTNTQIGGLGRSEKQCAKVKIGPVPMDKIAEFAPGGRQRVFLEEGLLPNFLPEGWEWETEIIVAEKDRAFAIAIEENPLRIGINSFVR
jgi:hypothetical protein